MLSKRLLVVGASWEQAPLIARAKELGHFVVAADPNPAADGFKLADAQAVCDPRDLSRLLEIARQHDVEAALADECDYSHYAATYVALQLNLPNDGLLASQRTTNKLWMRQSCAEAGIVQPVFKPCLTVEDALAAAREIGFPVVVKPVDNRGAFGVTIAGDETELASAFLHALANTHSRVVLIESKIEGLHVTVDGCIDEHGNHCNLAYAQKTIVPGKKPVIDRVTYPADLEAPALDALLEANDAVAAALGITGGLTHSEYIIAPDGRPFLIEAANRGGGVLTSAIIVPAMSGVDLSTLLIQRAIGNAYEVHPKPAKGCVILRFFVFQPGLVASLDGVEEAASLPGVLYLRMLIKEGDRLAPLDSAAGRHGFAILQANNPKEAEALMQAAQSRIRIRYC